MVVRTQPDQHLRETTADLVGHLVEEDTNVQGSRMLAIGYMRVAEDAPSPEVTNLREGIETYAAGRDLHLVDVLVETAGGGTSAFARLIETLRDRRAGVVIVPTLEHFAQFHGLRQALISLLTGQVENLVLVVLSDQEPHDEGIS